MKALFAFIARLIFRQGPPPKDARWSLYAHHLGDYMRRWIFRHPWGTLRLHHILRSDDDAHLHDHPFDFTSLLLTGGYVEETQTRVPNGRQLEHPVLRRHHKLERAQQVWPRFSIVRKKAEDTHRLILERPVWTFVISGPKRRPWGFHTELGWVGHEIYLNLFPEVVIARVGLEGYHEKLREQAAGRLST